MSSQNKIPGIIHAGTVHISTSDTPWVRWIESPTKGMLLATMSSVSNLLAAKDAAHDKVLAAVTAERDALQKELVAKSHQWEPEFDAISSHQEALVIQFCAEIAGPKGRVGSPPDPVRLLEMAQALYDAERKDFAPV